MFYIYYKQPANYIQIGEKWKKAVKGHPSRSRDLGFLLRFNAKIKLEWMRLKETLIQSSRRLGCTYLLPPLSPLFTSADCVILIHLAFSFPSLD